MRVRAGKRLIMLAETDKLNGEDYVNIADLQRLFREYARQVEREHPDKATRMADVADTLRMVAAIVPEMIQSVWVKPTKQALQEWGREGGRDGRHRDD